MTRSDTTAAATRGHPKLAEDQPAAPGTDTAGRITAQAAGLVPPAGHGYWRGRALAAIRAFGPDPQAGAGTLPQLMSMWRHLDPKPQCRVDMTWHVQATLCVKMITALTVLSAHDPTTATKLINAVPIRLTAAEHRNVLAIATDPGCHTIGARPAGGASVNWGRPHITMAASVAADAAVKRPKRWPRPWPHTRTRPWPNWPGWPGSAAPPSAAPPSPATTRFAAST